MALLEIRNLSVSFATSTGRFHAVRGIDMTVNSREVLAVVGESGSGKSVAMLATMGLLPATGQAMGAIRQAIRALPEPLPYSSRYAQARSAGAPAGSDAMTASALE